MVWLFSHTNSERQPDSFQEMKDKNEVKVILVCNEAYEYLIPPICRTEGHAHCINWLYVTSTIIAHRNEARLLSKSILLSATNRHLQSFSLSWCNLSFNRLCSYKVYIGKRWRDLTSMIKFLQLGENQKHKRFQNIWDKTLTPSR